MTGAFVSLSMQVIGLANDYLSFDVITEVSINDGDKKFPAIIVCNNRRFLKSKVAELPLFEKYKSRSNMGLQYWQNLLALEYQHIKPIDFAYLGAEMNGSIAASSFSVVIEPMPFLGSCYSVKPSTDTTFLTIAINLHVDESINYPEMKSGITVHLTESFDYYHPLHENAFEIYVPPGQKAIYEISYEVRKKLNGSYAQCQDDEDLFYERTGLGYTQNTCLRECHFRTILSKFRCILSPFYFPFWVKTNITGYEFCKSIWEIKKTLKKCDCKPKCNTLIYGVVDKVTNKLEDKVDCDVDPFQESCHLLYQLTTENITKEWLKDNTAFITLFFSDTPLKTYEQKPRYPLVRFLSDIGGTMGLYLGASILTTFEFVQMAISGILHVVRNVKQKYRLK